MVKTLNPYEIMWLLCLFDLPTDTKAARKLYTQFRKELLGGGFVMLQYSVYGRCFPSEDHLSTHIKHLKSVVPPDGEVRLVTITDKQFSKSQILRGKVRKVPEAPPKQLTFF